MICLLPGQGLVGLMGRQFLLDRLEQGPVTLQCRLLTPQRTFNQASSVFRKGSGWPMC